MLYFFALGNHSLLSVAELSAIFGLKKNQFKFNLLSPAIFILEIDNLQPEELIKKIGGTIKIGTINEKWKISKKLKRPDQKEAIRQAMHELIATQIKEAKFNFGLSYYGKNNFYFNDIALEVKKNFKKEKYKIRWVSSRETILSSVIVEQNNLNIFGKGIEIVLIDTPDEILIGQTLAVQPFKTLSYRDYGRPARDNQSGMLPPKLAQIMLNLTEIKSLNAFILDPFCGSGTILMEAVLMGYKNLIGSDISSKAIQDSQLNLDWIKEKFLLKKINLKLINQDARQISKSIQGQSLDAIIGEPYLGPQRGKLNLKETTRSLEKLYSQILVELKKVLKENGTIVMAWPVFSFGAQKNFIQPDLNGFKIINPLPEELKFNKNRDRIYPVSNREVFLYGRANQTVWREIVILKRQ